MTRAMRTTPILLLALLLLGSTSARAEEEELPKTPSQARKAERYRPTGTVHLEGASVSFGVGFRWGHGTLDFGGETRSFRLTGLGLIGLGGGKVTAEGSVFNLERAEDFEGAWLEVDAGAALGPLAAGGITMRNGDVFMTLATQQEGVELSAGAGAISVEFIDAAAEEPADD